MSDTEGLDRAERYLLQCFQPYPDVGCVLIEGRRFWGLASWPFAGQPWPPAFFGAGAAMDGHADIASNVDKYLADGFGQLRS